MNKLIVFDLDGTLCYTIEDIALSVNYALKENAFPTLSQEKIMSLVGNSVAYMIRNSLPEGSNEEQINAVFNAYTDYYAEHLCDHVRIYPEVIETLTELKNRGYMLACVSNKPNSPCNDMIKKLFPEKMFSFVLGMLPSLKRKPASQPLDFVIDYLDGDKEKSYYVGDSEVDITFAKNTGVQCISCAWGYRKEEFLISAGATRIIHHFSELNTVIE